MFSADQQADRLLPSGLCSAGGLQAGAAQYHYSMFFPKSLISGRTLGSGVVCLSLSGNLFVANPPVLTPIVALVGGAVAFHLSDFLGVREVQSVWVLIEG